MPMLPHLLKLMVLTAVSISMQHVMIIPWKMILIILHLTQVVKITQKYIHNSNKDMALLYSMLSSFDPKVSYRSRTPTLNCRQTVRDIVNNTDTNANLKKAISDLELHNVNPKLLKRSNRLSKNPEEYKIENDLKRKIGLAIGVPKFSSKLVEVFSYPASYISNRNNISTLISCLINAYQIGIKKLRPTKKLPDSLFIIFRRRKNDKS